MFRIIPINKWMVVGFILMVVGFLLLTVLIGIVIMPVGIVIFVFGMHKAIYAEGRRFELALIRKIPDAKNPPIDGFSRGATETIRTSDLLLRREALYPG